MKMKVQVAVVQSTPVFFDKEATLAKLSHIVADEAQKGSQLILFPESFIPGYPRGFTFESAIGYREEVGRDLYVTYWQESLSMDEPAFDQLVQLAILYQVYLVVGITERDPVNGSLYCTVCYFSPSGFLGKHRKLKPTGVERLVWGEGDGTDLQVYDTSLGKMGGLICWENYMLQARWKLYQGGVQLYMAPTADARPTWTATMQHIACESRSFVLGCNQFFQQADYPKALQVFSQNKEAVICRGGSLIVSPLGEIIAGPLYDQEGILRASLDLDDIIRAKMDFDPIGHYHKSLK